MSLRPNWDNLSCTAVPIAKLRGNDHHGNPTRNTAGGKLGSVPAVAPAELSQWQHQSVLVVDDEPGMRRLTALILERAGFEVAVAGDGEDALQVAAGARPDVALLDVKLGSESGLDVMQRLRAQHPNLSVVLMSGFHEQQIDPAIPILEKPFAPEALVSAVTRAVRAGLPEVN